MRPSFRRFLLVLLALSLGFRSKVWAMAARCVPTSAIRCVVIHSCEAGISRGHARHGSFVSLRLIGKCNMKTIKQLFIIAAPCVAGGFAFLYSDLNHRLRISRQTEITRTRLSAH
jgi:hypothetical protein